MMMPTSGWVMMIPYRLKEAALYCPVLPAQRNLGDDIGGYFILERGDLVF